MRNPEYQDQIRYCERCGISFLWGAEEQRAANGDAPSAEAQNDNAPSGDPQNGQGQNLESDSGKADTPPPLTTQRTPAHNATTTPPTHCPGCRELLPAPGRERGLVKWYNRRKRFGFLVRRDHPEIFAHGSDISGAGAMHPGDLVEFTVAENERGPAAKAITILAHGDAPTPD